MKLKKEIKFILYVLINIITIWFVKDIIRTNITDNMKTLGYIFINAVYVLELIKKD